MYFDSIQEIRQFEFNNIFILFFICGVFVVKLFWMVTKTIHNFVFFELLFSNLNYYFSEQMKLSILQYY